MALVELVVLLVIVAFAIAGAVAGWDRYRPGRQRGPSARAEPTNEVFVDPETGRRMRVWFDPSTGRREYRPD